MTQPRTLFVLGGTGFIGREVVAHALVAGHRVRGLARSGASRDALAAAGAEPVEGEAQQPDRWSSALEGADVLIDLVQPAFPRRLSARAVAKIAARRQATTEGVLEAVSVLAPEERPVVVHVSGVDDLAPGPSGVVDHTSPPRTDLHGFATVGVPVRRRIERSGLDAAFVYFGVMVYGAGKVFADVYVKGLRKGRAAILGPGDNRLPLTHVHDAARALVHVAGLPREEIAGRTFVAADGSDGTQRDLLEHTATLMGARRPRSIPVALARIAAGSAAVETMTLDVHADPSHLVSTGFSFDYPSYREGVPEVLARLGEAP